MGRGEGCVHVRAGQRQWHDAAAMAQRMPTMTVASEGRLCGSGVTRAMRVGRRAKQKRQELEEGVKGSLWAFEGMPREELDIMFMGMVRRLEVSAHEGGNGRNKEGQQMNVEKVARER
eukprot:3936892-Rhodomonas_salina.2